MSPTKCWICDNYYVDGVDKVKDHYHISLDWDYNIKVKVNHKIPILFHNLKNYESHLIMPEIGKFDFKTNVIPNKLEKYMNPNINNKLTIIDSFKIFKFFVRYLS